MKYKLLKKSTLMTPYQVDIQKSNQLWCRTIYTVNLQLHAQHLMYPQSLPDTQVKHDFFTSTRDSISSDIPIQPLDLGSLSSTAVTQATKDLTSFASAELESCGALCLQAGNGATELQHGFGLAHLLALVHKILEPVIRRFDLSGHMRQFHTDHRVIDEALAKRLALVCILHRFLVANTRKAYGLDDDSDALVVKVGHDDLESLVLLADKVLHGDFDVFKGNVGGAAGPYTLAVHLAGRNTASAALDQKNGHAIHARSTSAHRRGEVVAPDTIGNPFLLTIDNVMLSIFR